MTPVERLAALADRSGYSAAIMRRVCTVWARDGRECERCGGPVLAATFDGETLACACRDCVKAYEPIALPVGQA